MIWTKHLQFVGFMSTENVLWLFDDIDQNATKNFLFDTPHSTQFNY